MVSEFLAAKIGVDKYQVVPIPLHACVLGSKAHNKTLEGHCKLHSYFSDLVS
jgi:hypothetical protein